MFNVYSLEKVPPVEAIYHIEWDKNQTQPKCRSGLFGYVLSDDLEAATIVYN